jgi:hypothetical protein
METHTSSTSSKVDQMADKQITLDIPSDAPSWAHSLFASQYEMRLEFRQHLKRCQEQHADLRCTPPDPLAKLERWVKLVLMIGALVGGYLAVHDLKVTRSRPPQVTVQAAHPQTVMVPYPVTRDASPSPTVADRPLRHRRRR